MGRWGPFGVYTEAISNGKQFRMEGHFDWKAIPNGRSFRMETNSLGLWPTGVLDPSFFPFFLLSLSTFPFFPLFHLPSFPLALLPLANWPLSTFLVARVAALGTRAA